MYAALVWAAALERGANKDILRSAHRTALIRTTTSYRTTSYQALCVLAGRMPIHIKAGMWRRVFIARAEYRKSLDSRGNPVLIVERIAMAEWQAS